MSNIISFHSPKNHIDKSSTEYAQYKFMIPEHKPIKLSNGSYLHTFKVTEYNQEDKIYGDSDEEQECVDREMYG